MAIQRVLTCGAALLAAALAGSAGAWEPTKSVEFIIPAGTGGGGTKWPALPRAWSRSTT